MNSITKERIELFINNPLENGLTRGEQMELARIALASLAAVSDERAAYELFMEKRFGESVDRRRAKNGDREYMAWDMALGWIIWCHRAAMLQGGQPVSNCDELQVIGWLRSDYNSDDKRDPNAPLFMLGRNDPSDAWGVKYIQLSGNSPVSPGGWISCSERMPDDGQWCVVNTEYGYYVQCWSEGQGWLGDDISIPECDVINWMPLPEPPQEVK
ncbi:hypothetical protein CSM69_17035 [Salmonella enterica subsp. enterica serovar Infantis]|nr:hypothetical protein [Salmonella enterica subsp. enterica serovar Infantis]